MRRVKWGVLGAARIARVKVIPAMQKSEWSEVAAIASRDGERARALAESLEIPKAYGSYEELLEDPDIEVIYNPLPNHLHVPWSVRAAEAGKHVLCEKPVGRNAAECEQLVEARNRTGVRIGEAFMIRTHPQWLRARELVRSRELGRLQSVVVNFSYMNGDARNIRNRLEWGGGGLLDIGCYAVQASRYLFEEEPVRVAAAIVRHPEWGVDTLSSGLLEFPSGHCVFTCGTLMVASQRVQAFCEHARIEIPIPFNAPPDRPTSILIDTGMDLFGGGIREEQFAVCDQYTLQADLFSRAVVEGTEVPTPLEDSLQNMRVLDRLFQAAGT